MTRIGFYIIIIIRNHQNSIVNYLGHPDLLRDLEALTHEADALKQEVPAKRSRISGCFGDLRQGVKPNRFVIPFS